ncbi:hypothetical protein DWF00_00885 [Bosea caraganae]|uniref:Uncharacterized protein n=1 Tax=Bosea caraganae TaxID=2763117 RepID=A0A370L939_9HYPH|nr:hypothetical protein DWE98_07900 [Bosea caraganae]RDJ30653.1 hypothetical protein DWF00_00885 [Bosea caraganae]
MRAVLFPVMLGLVPSLHVLRRGGREDVDGRDKPDHDDDWPLAPRKEVTASSQNAAPRPRPSSA